MRTSAHFDAKKLQIFRIYGVSARTRVEGLSQCGHFAKGPFFAILCGRLLWTTPNKVIHPAERQTQSTNFAGRPDHTDLIFSKLLVCC